MDPSENGNNNPNEASLGESAEDDESYETVGEEADENSASENFSLSEPEVEIEVPAGGSGCRHYDCKCSIVSPCCNKVYFCRICHNEAEEDGHEVDRFAIQTIVCRECETRQPPAEHCSNCNVKFGGYCCIKCRLFDFTDKKQWHCEGCGICRVGGQENFFHCDRCGYCLATTLRETHACVRDASKNNCPVCWAPLHDSRIPLMISKCGHPMHKTCWNELFKNKIYSCPLCKKMMVDVDWKQTDELMAELVSQNQIPEAELREVEVICNDCQKKSKQKDYLVGLFKCEHCGGYNTQK